MGSKWSDVKMLLLLLVTSEWALFVQEHDW